jgi:endonuclease/exonuclease/phosphatase family metal-dependent hydrolase
MKRFPALLLAVLLGAGAYFAWQFYHHPPPAPPVVVATPAPTPASTPEPPPEPTPLSRTAPEGVLYVVKRFTAPIDGGLHAFTPGLEVRLVRPEAGYFVVADGPVQGRAPKSWFTRDLDLAAALRENRLADYEAAQKLLAEGRAAAARRDEELRERAETLSETLAREEGARSPAGVAAAAAPPLQPAARSGPLRVGAWNLEFFGSRSDPPRTSEDLDAIAEYIRKLGVDALVLTEVDGDKPVRDLCRRLGPEWKSEVGSSKTGGNPGGAQQAVAVIWNDRRLDLLAGGELTQLPRKLDGLPVFHRLPVSACLRDRSGGPDFRLIGVHFKAGRDAESNRKRRLEMGELRRYLDGLVAKENEDQDVVVLGDFNSGTTFPEAEAFTDKRMASYLTKPGAGTTIIHFNQQIDQIVPLTTFAEIKAGTFEIHNREGLRDRDAWRKTYSDHFPVTVDLAATPDDDPAAEFSPPGR